jgi:hypothetical protein
VKAGDFKVGSVRLATLFVLSSLNWTYQWLDPQGPLTLEQLSGHYCGLILKSLGSKA